jgi:hypothetical protein
MEKKSKNSVQKNDEMTINRTPTSKTDLGVDPV